MSDGIGKGIGNNAASAPQFGDVYQQIQSKYGERPEKPREVKKSLGKDDFLKIMMTQLKNQDPTSPFKPEEMATQMAQMTSVEQLQNINQALGKMSDQNKPLERMEMTHLIGKTVTVDRQRFPHVAGESDALSLSLGRDAKQVEIVLINEKGEEVFRKDLGEQKKGEVKFNWDGIQNNSLPAKAGNYLLRAQAVDEAGHPIEMNNQAKAQIVGVSFEGSDPVFLTGTPNHYEKIPFKNIIRVEVDAPVTPAAPSMGMPSVAVPSMPAPMSRSTPDLMQRPASDLIQIKKGGEKA